MKAFLATAAFALLISTASFAQTGGTTGQPAGGGQGCDNKLKPECSKSPGAPSAAPMMRHHRMSHHHRRHHHHAMRHRHHKKM